MGPAPSGEQFELVHGDQVAVVTEVGATLRSYRAGERAVIDDFDVDARADGARGQPLIPWPNRIRDGRYEWDGEPQQLALSEPARANAIHGLVRWSNWVPLAWGPARITLGLRLHPSPGYPFTLGLTIDYELTDEGLTVQAYAENLGSTACPYGVGFHPYITVGELIDGARLTLPFERHLLCDERAIPVSSAPVAGTPFDFRRPREIGPLRLDSCFCEPRRDPDGRTRVILENGAGAAVTLWMGAAFPYAMVFSGDTLAPERRRRGLAVEPMSCAPNAFASGAGGGVVTLAPGRTHVAEWGLTP